MAEKTGQTRSNDWFLVGIVVAVVGLVVLTLVLVFRDSAPPEYRPDNTADGVAYNYFLAIQQKNYDRAYGYLSADIDKYPASAGAFFDEIQGDWSCTSEEIARRSFAVSKSELFDDRAVVTISETTFSGSRDLFSSGRYTQIFTVRLARQGSDWKITESDHCWAPDWRK